MAEDCGPYATYVAEGAQSSASAWSGYHSSRCIIADGLCRMCGGLQGHPVMDCSHFGSRLSGAVGMAWELLPIMSGMVCCSGLGSFWYLRIKSLMLSTALGQGDLATSVLPLLMDSLPLARLNWCLLPTEKMKRPPGCPVCLT